MLGITLLDLVHNIEISKKILGLKCCQYHLRTHITFDDRCSKMLTELWPKDENVGQPPGRWVDDIIKTASHRHRSDLRDIEANGTNETRKAEPKISRAKKLN